MNSSNWDNLRFVLTVAETGSVSAAARQLGVTHATVLRRVAAFEEAHGGAVFHKSARGYEILPDRLRVIEAAQDVARAMTGVRRAAEGSRIALQGPMRISSTDTLCVYVLPALAAHLQTSAPDLQVEVMSTNSHLDLSRLQADLTVRVALKLPDDLRGEQAGWLRFAVYARPDAPDFWLGLSGPLQKSLAAAWMAEHVPAEQISVQADSFLVLRNMAAQGLGRVLLPDFIQAEAHGLEKVAGYDLEMRVPIWVASHLDLSDSPRIREVQRASVAFLQNSVLVS